MAYVAKLWSLNAAATELGIDRRTLGKRLDGLEPDGGSEARPAWLMKNIFEKLSLRSKSSDLDEERTRLARAQADAKEVENRARNGELIEVAVMDMTVIAAFARVRSRLLSMPSKLAPILCPDAPADAEAVLVQHVHEALRELAETNVSELEEQDGEVVADLHAATGSDGI